MNKSLLVAVLCCLLIAPFAYANSRSITEFKIRQGPLSAALNQFAEQSRLQLVVNYEHVKQLESRGLNGKFRPKDALTQLIAGSDLAFEFLNPRTVAVYVNLPDMDETPDKAHAIDTNKAVKTKDDMLETVIVTSRRIPESWQQVPLSVSLLQSDQIGQRFLASDPVAAYSLAAPGLYAESSSGRTAPRFYLRGLGNADFNQGASQPVSIVYDYTPLEKPALRSFPVFDISAIEVLRGPQGSLFGRNTTAGTIIISSNKPSQSPQGYVDVMVGQLGTLNTEVAFGGPLLTNKLMGRVALYSQHKDNYIDNGFTQENDAIGGFDDFASRLHLQWEPNQRFSSLLTGQYRRLTGHSSTPFRANTLTKGSNKINENYEAERVFYDGGGNQKSTLEHSSIALTLEQTSQFFTTTMVNAYQHLTRFGRADVDGGFGTQYSPGDSGPGLIPASVDTGSDSDLTQRSHELRIQSFLNGEFNFQAGLFYFEDKLDFFDLNANERPFFRDDIGILSRTELNNSVWALFTQGRMDLSDSLRLTAGVRYTYDKKFAVFTAPPTSSAAAGINAIEPVYLDDSYLSWDISIAKDIDKTLMLYARVASGFRAPTIQTSVRQEPNITTAGSESVTSFEIGANLLLSEKFRINLNAYHYLVRDLQLSEVGGTSNAGGVSLANAERGTGYGAEIDLVSKWGPYLTISMGLAMTRTRLQDDSLSASICLACTVTDPLDANGRALIDGNRFQHVPEWTFNGSLDYARPINSLYSAFFFSEWQASGPRNDFLYESIEFITGTQFEGKIKIGIRNDEDGSEFAFFVNNVTNETNVIGSIDFNNLTTYVNERRVAGLQFRYVF